MRTDEGREIFVPLSVLKQKSDVDDGEYSHILSAPANGYLSAPAEPVELPPQTKREMLVEQQSLNRLFLTVKSKREVIAPGNSQPTFEGETCWAAYVCTNPECPAKDQGKNGRPYLFINTNNQGGALCPACKPLWASEQDDPDAAAHYRSYARLYELSESARRQAELDKIRKQAAADRRAKYAKPEQP